MIFEHQTYRSYLKTELADRIAANESYSLRAFALRLGFSSGFLSEVLQGKKSLSADAALRVAMRLELNNAETHYFGLLAQSERETDPAAREAIELKLKDLNPGRRGADLSLDVFRAISDWYHLAILELTFLAGFRLTPASAAAKLGITKAEADAAIDRLMRLELLEKDAEGRMRKTQGYVLAKSAVPNQALKSFHGQLLKKASEALTDQEPMERYSASDVLPIDSRQLESVRRLSDQYASELLKLAGKAKQRDHVYCMSLHFFKLTPERKN